MPRAKLAVTLPAEVWIARLSRDHPDAQFRVLGALQTDEGGTGVLEVSAPDPEAVVEALGRFESVELVEQLASSGEQAHLQFRTSTPLLLVSAEAAGLPLQLPVVIADGVATVWTAGPGERLASFVDQLEELGMSVAVQTVAADIDSDRLLTDRQRDVLLAAVEQGYYETPRACSLTDLAAELDLAQSTVSETLHRAEGRVITAFTDALPTDRADEEWPAS